RYRVLRMAYIYLRRMIGEPAAVAFYDFWNRRLQQDLPTRPALAARLLRRATKDVQHLPASGQYVLIHVMLPHPPFVLSADGRLGPQPRRPTLLDYRAQILYADGLVGRLLTELKLRGRYEDALILVH